MLPSSKLTTKFLCELFAIIKAISITVLQNGDLNFLSEVQFFIRQQIMTPCNRQELSTQAQKFITHKGFMKKCFRKNELSDFNFFILVDVNKMTAG